MWDEFLAPAVRRKLKQDTPTIMLRRRQLKLILATLACGVLVWLTLGESVGGAQSVEQAQELSAQEKRGKQLYLKGEGVEGAGEIKAFLGSDKLEVPASAFACSNCHGLRGEGTREGGLQPPPIKWDALVAPHTSALTRRARAPYTEATLARAIKLGLDPSGAPLYPGMPQYDLKPEQMADLISYLKKLGKEKDANPGLDDKRLKVDAAKTFVEATKLSGSQPNRSALLTSLEALNDFKTGVVPPLTFGPNRRIGASGCYIVGVDLTKKQYIPLGARLVPKDRK